MSRCASRLRIGVFVLVVLFRGQPLVAGSAGSSSMPDGPWEDDSGRTVRLSHWRGARVVLTMSYATCRKTCPLVTMAVLDEIQKRLDDHGQSAQFAVVTLDPTHDTRESLARYRSQRGLERANWHFLRGDQRNTERLAKWLAVAVVPSDTHIFHTFKIVVLNESGDVEHVFDWKHRDVSRVVD